MNYDSGDYTRGDNSHSGSYPRSTHSYSNGRGDDIGRGLPPSDNRFHYTSMSPRDNDNGPPRQQPPQDPYYQDYRERDQDSYRDYDSRYDRDSYRDRERDSYRERESYRNGDYYREPDYNSRDRDSYRDQDSFRDRDSYRDRDSHRGRESYRDREPYPDLRPRDSPRDSYNSYSVDRNNRNDQHNGALFNPNYSRDNSRDGMDTRDIRLQERAPALSNGTSSKPKKSKKPITTKDFKLQNLKTRWKKLSPQKRRRYCCIGWFILLSVLAIIIAPMAVYVRVWHRLTWGDIVKLRVEPRNIKWGQQGRYVYYKDYTNNIIRVDLSKEDPNNFVEVIFKFEFWDKVGYDDFDVTGPQDMLILAKNTGQDNYITYKNLYKYKWSNSTVEPELFFKDVVDWEVISNEKESMIVFTQKRDTFQDKGYNILIQRLDNQKSLIVLGDRMMDAFHYRGVLSYMYAREFFGGSKGFWQSPDGKFIVFMETQVNTGSMLNTRKNSTSDVMISYPYAGKNAPKVRLKMYSIELSRQVDANEALNPEGKQDRYYITAVSYPNSNKVLVEFMNRQQTRAVTEECELNQSPSCVIQPALRRTADQSWLPRYGAAAYGAEPNKVNQKYYALRPVLVRQTNYTQLHLYDDPKKPNVKVPITNGMFDVTELIGNDHSYRYILYIRTELIDLSHEYTSVTRKRLVFMYDSKENSHTCISCLEPDGRCDYSRAEIDGTRQWYLLYCLGRSIPYNKIRRFGNLTWSLYGDGNQNMMYENPSYQAQLAQKKRARTEFTQVELDEHSEMYNAVKKWFPLYYVKYLNILKWPLVIIVDPRPDKNMALMKYGLGLSQWLAIDKDAVVMTTDVKGTPGRGLEFHHHPYQDLNKIVAESERTIRDILLYWHVDRKKVALLGRGMGGWLALKLVERQPDWFKSVVVLDPIINFEEYLGAFSERYLDTLDRNANGYRNSTVTLSNDVSWGTKTAIYYNPYNLNDPGSAKYIRDIAGNLTSFNIFNTTEILNRNKLNTGDPWLDIGQNVTEFLSEGDHSIF